jgi:hypothetical protein
MEQERMYTYRKVPYLKYAILYASLDDALSRKTATDSSDPKIGDPSTKRSILSIIR